MNAGALLFLGAFLTLATSFWGLIIVPQLQIGQQQQVKLELTGVAYPVPASGRARAGADVYVANGCAECHTQQVRPRDYGTDFKREWGLRRTVAQDYVFDNPVQLGSLRLGPDLTNIGLRQTNATWHLAHLYNPRLLVPGSMMPRYTYLFEKRALRPGETVSGDALQVENLPEGVEIVPKPEARALVAYLLSLRAAAPLFEAPLPPSPTNAVSEAGATNNVDTNATPPNGSPTNPVAQ